MNIKEFIIFIAGLAVLLVGVSVILDQLMAVFIVSILTCVVLICMENEKEKKNSKL